MKKDHALEQGFTLIEIIIVLVLLGILAATAVPKYFDLVETANQKAATSAIAEVQARLNLTFANELLAGKTCDNALATAKAVPAANTTIGKYTLTIEETFAPNGTTKVDEAAVTKIVVTGASKDEEIKAPDGGWTPISAPSCTDKGTKSETPTS